MEIPQNLHKYVRMCLFIYTFVAKMDDFNDPCFLPPPSPQKKKKQPPNEVRDAFSTQRTPKRWALSHDPNRHHPCRENPD